MSAWTVDRDDRTLLGYRRTHGNITLVVAPTSGGWVRSVVGAGVLMLDGATDGPISGMEAADLALRAVLGPVGSTVEREVT